jgi:hypothetical protein
MTPAAPTTSSGRRRRQANDAANRIHNPGTEDLRHATSAERGETSTSMRGWKGEQHLVGSLCGRGW